MPVPRTLLITIAFVFGSSLHAQQGQVLPRFVDVSDSAGVLFKHDAGRTSQKYLIETMGAGVALLDYDGDGLLDIFFVNGAALADPMLADYQPEKSAPIYWNRLYRNLGDWRFEDVTEAAGVAGQGYGMGAAVGDYDHDGDPDLYVTNFGRNTLWQNEGDGSFTDATRRAGVAAGGWSASAAFLDYDRDGLLDLFVARYLDWDFAKSIPCGNGLPERRSYCHPRRFEPVEHRLYRNNDDGKFEDVSSDAGISAHAGKGLGVALGDYDADGWVDIFVANDSLPQQLFRNVGGKRFDEVGVDAGVAYDADGRDFAGMGAAFEDYDNDGRPDIFVNALARQSYWLFRNRGGEFESTTKSSGLGTLTDLHSGWGTGLVDFDNDCWRDLFVAQGHVMDDIEWSDPSLSHHEPLLLLKNVFGRFFDVSRTAGPAFREPIAGRGAAFGDLDNDGRIDMVVNANGQQAVVLRNVTEPKNHWLSVRLDGEGDREVRGARVRIETVSGRIQEAFVGSAGSYLSANDTRIHFGLGNETSVTKLQIVWPGGTVQTMEDVEGDQHLTVHQSTLEQP